MLTTLQKSPVRERDVKSVEGVRDCDELLAHFQLEVHSHFVHMILFMCLLK